MVESLARRVVGVGVSCVVLFVFVFQAICGTLIEGLAELLAVVLGASVLLWLALCLFPCVNYQLKGTEQFLAARAAAAAPPPDTTTVADGGEGGEGGGGDAPPAEPEDPTTWEIGLSADGENIESWRR